MAYPLRRYEDGVDESESVRPMGPVIVEDDPVPATAPAGARVPPRRLPPGVSGTEFEQSPLPSRRPILPLSGPPRLVGHYISFLPAVVVVVFLALVLVAIGGVRAISALSFPL